ncbi:MAG: FtsX-like permease family protein, partial [Erysipelotrichaceae bacterium]|nr:FtsX-like permease family protein [Erysipelotrichaceae bacterium]
MYITLDGARDTMSNSDQYDRFIKENKVIVENIASEQQSFLIDRLVKEASDQLEENEKLFEDLKDQGQKQLDEAKKQLDDANIQIIAYESQLSTLEALINSLQAAIKADSEILNSIYGFTVDLEGDINDILEILGQNSIHYASGTMEYLYKEYNNAISQFDSIKGMMNSAKAEYESGLKEYEEALTKFNEEIADGEEQLRLARARLNDLPKSKWIILDRDLQYSTLMFKNTCVQMGVIGLYMPIMFFLVAALVCLTTMKRLVDEQRGQIGIYAALGYSNLKIISKYVSYALYASLAGGILGIIFGQILFPTVIYDTWKILYYFPSQKVLFPPDLALLSVGSFAVLMTGITAYVVNNSVKDVPASLMRPIAPKKGKEIMLEKIPFLWNMLSFTSKITARNIFRYKSRFLMTIAGIAGCAGLLILGFGIKDSVSDVLGIQYKELFRYDCLLYFNGTDHIEENLEILKQSDDVDFAATYLEYATKVYIGNGEKTANVAIVDTSDYSELFALRETDKKTPIRLNNDGVIISELFAKNNGLKVGDYITIESGNRIKGDVRIVNICELYFQHYIFMSDALYQNTFDEEAKGNIIAVLTDDGEALRKLAGSLKDYASMLDTSYFLDSFNNMIEALNLVIMVIIMVAGSLAFVVLINLTQVNISERIREIATLKVLGCNDHEVNMYIFKEILLLSVIGCFVGVPIGILEHRFIMNVISMEMIMFARTINFSSYLISFAITIVFTIIVLLFMRKPLRKVNMVESLKSVE